jgi:hypothetical protein
MFPSFVQSPCPIAISPTSQTTFSVRGDNDVEIFVRVGSKPTLSMPVEVSIHGSHNGGGFIGVGFEPP